MRARGIRNRLAGLAFGILWLALAARVLSDESGGWGGRALLVSLFVLLWGIFQILLGARRPALAFGLLPLALVSLGSQVKRSYLGRPAFFWDLNYFLGRDQLDVLLQYRGALGVAMIAGAALAVLGLLFAWVRAEQSKASALGERRRLVRQGGIAACVGALLLPLAGALLRSEVPSWDYWDSMGKRHPFAIFVVSLVQSRPSLVPEPMKDLAAPKPASAKSTGPQMKEMARKRTPHLVAILEESIFDPRTLGGSFSRNPRWDSLIREGGTQGALKVHVVGGGTWCSEFSFLTGLPSTALGIMGGYSTYVMEGRVRHSLVSHLESLGYRTVAIYAGSGRFVNGRRFHDSLGFDRFLDSKDHAVSGRAAWKLRDEDIFATVLRVFEEHEREHAGQPLFVFVKTIRNHGPHGNGCSRLRESPLAGMVRERGIREPGDCALIDYLSRLDEGVVAYAGLKRELVRRFPSRSFSLLQFGDHQPTFTAGLQDGKGNRIYRGADRYVTYHHEELVGPGRRTVRHERGSSPVRAPAAGKLDLAYLAAAWLEGLDLPLDSVLARRLEVARSCRGDYPIAAGSADEACFREVRRLHGFLLEEGVFDL